MLRWRMAGLERSAEEASLRFFIEWGAETPYPGEALPQSAALDSVVVDEAVLEPALWA